MGGALMRLSDADALALVERAYDLETPPDAWLREIAERVYAHLGRGRGASAFYYRITDDDRVEIEDPIVLDADFLDPTAMRMSMQALPPEFVRKSFVRCECTTQSASLDDEMREQLGPIFEAMASAFGWRDVAMLGGMDPTGRGVYVGAWLPEETRLSPRTQAMWTRIAVHLAAANRLRGALSRAEGGETEAVLRPSGAVEHAEGEARTKAAREALRGAVQMMEKARGPLRREEPHTAVATWRGLAGCRWSLVDQFESDGTRYVVARRNEALVGGLAALSERERQALAYAAMGHGNKLVAYEMGISPSTVGVLLHKAAKKLGARSREELIASYRTAQRSKTG